MLCSPLNDTNKQTNKQNDKQFKGRLVHWVVWGVGMAEEEEEVEEEKESKGAWWSLRMLLGGEEDAITGAARQMALLHHRKRHRLHDGRCRVLNEARERRWDGGCQRSSVARETLPHVTCFFFVQSKIKQTNNSSAPYLWRQETEDRSGLSSDAQLWRSVPWLMWEEIIHCHTTRAKGWVRYSHGHTGNTASYTNRNIPKVLL